MPSEKVAGALERLGVDVPADSFNHYGVPGMKWGQHKAQNSGSKSSSSVKKPSPETMARVRLATAGIAVPGVLVGGVAVLAGISAAGKMSQTVRDIRNVNSAAGVFNPNSLLSRQNG